MPITHNGKLLVAPTYSQFEEDASFHGMLLEASAGDTVIQDLEISTQVYMAGGYYWAHNCNVGDYVEVSVVDKNDVLGLFGAFGLEVGLDVLELAKFVVTHYLKPGGVDWAELLTEDVAPVIPGLFVRAKYVNTGTQAASIGITYRWFEE